MTVTSAEIETITGTPLVKLNIGNSVTIEFSSMDDLARFSDNLHSLIANWRVENAEERLEDTRKAVIDSTMIQLRQILQERYGAKIAEGFSTDLFVNGDWVIDLEAQSPDQCKITIEAHVRSLLVALVPTFDALDTALTDRRVS